MQIGNTLERAAYYLAFAAAIAPILSTAASNILLGAAALTLLLAHRKLLMPPIGLPLGLFIAGTLAAIALSRDPAAGLPQLKKFYVFLILPVVYTGLRHLEDVRKLTVAWAVAAAASAVWSFVEFWLRYQEAMRLGSDFYSSYIGNRTSGFMSHWMTFAAEQMIVLAVLCATLLFAPLRRGSALLWSCVVLIVASLIIGFTRGVWLASVISLVYLIAVWRPKWLLAAPLVLGMALMISPKSVRERALSIYQPHGTLDSNEHRRVTRIAGWEMVKAHPFFGLGPEIVGRDFDRFVPAYIQRPLPTGYYGHLHNMYLQYAAERGVPTLLALLWLIGRALTHFVQALRHSSPLGRGVLHGAIAVMIAILVEGLSEMNLGDSEVLAMFLTVIACGYIARESTLGRKPV